jgi:serine/threonine protein phosphatase PrpC
MKFTTKSDLGRRRQTNQDCCAAKILRSDLLLCAVCDGMGGAAGGEIASNTAIKIFFEFIESKIQALSEKELQSKKVYTLLSNAVRHANTAVYSAAQKNPELYGMGTTLVAFLATKTQVYCANVGDSRMYYMNKHGILQCSHDHSYVQYLVDLGKMTEEEARYSMKRNIITRAVGTSDSVNADVMLTDIDPRERGYILLCSDGLTNHVSDGDIYQTVVNSELSLEAKTDALISSANANGGSDNITVVLTAL